jgi:hypothetical protein
VVVGDWVIFRPNRPVRLEWAGGVTYCLDERQVLGIVKVGDEPFFVDADPDEVAELVAAG